MWTSVLFHHPLAGGPHDEFQLDEHDHDVARFEERGRLESLNVDRSAQILEESRYLGPAAAELHPWQARGVSAVLPLDVVRQVAENRRNVALPERLIDLLHGADMRH